MKKNQDKRIGLILASIHTGSSLNLWTALAGEAARAGVSFFVFPGGRLDSLPDSEYLRNSIYRLANTENLNSLISWGSSIGGAVAIGELEKFHRALDPLPYVTIAHKMEGHPSVRFDAYSGMKSLMRHFLEVHGARKIAFIRGPSSHLSAEDRFRAYEDALTEAGIKDEYWRQLASDPFPWTAGEAAVVQLCESRGLVPGQDFDTLVGASDMMVLAAVQYLEGRGYEVPGDFRCGGFNDSAESRILSSPLTTVHMPYAELGLTALHLVRTFSGSGAPQDPGRTRADQETVLSTELVIRESCGCGNGPWLLASAAQCMHGDAGRRREGLFRQLSELFRLDETDRNAFLQPLFSILEEGKIPDFLNLLEKVLFRYFGSDREPRLLFQAIGLVKEAGCFAPETINPLIIPVLQLVSQVQARVMALEKFETGKRDLVLNSLKCDLLCTRDRQSLIQILCRHLPAIGIHSAALVIHVDEEYSRFLGGFVHARELPEDGEPFPSRHLLPANLRSGFHSDVFLIQPLFMENQSLGYVVCNVPFHIGSVFEELRSSLSSALRGIFLFEETLAAQKRAEEAERAQTEFFANVGSDLSDPLEELAVQLVELEALVTSGPGRIPDLARRMGALRSNLASQIDRTNRLMDLTLSQTNELPFNRRLFHPGELFPDKPETGSAGLPLLFGDPERFRQALHLLRVFYDGKLATRCLPRGFSITLFPSSPVVEPARFKNEVMLAEKLVLLQYGDFSRDSLSCSLVLPWPNLAGLPPLKTFEAKGILEFSDRLPLQDFGLPLYQPARDIDPALLANEGSDLVLAWNPDEAPLEQWLMIYALRHHPRLFRMPFLCYGSCFQGEGLIKGIEARVKDRNQGGVLVVSTGNSLYEPWASEDRTVRIRSMEEFNGALLETTPAIIIFESVDTRAIHQVRRHPDTGTTPIIVLPDKMDAGTDIEELCRIPHVLLCNRGIAGSAEFSSRMATLLAGKELLPPHTGALVKKAILYFNLHAATPIARWRLAQTVNLSEDYLTRIFHRETGFSPWEYLSRYRILLASERLLNTDETINEVAQQTGFQDQAYFCRVFKKIHGIPPGKYRSSHV
ncbi:MAG: hypothetical protein A3J97_10330 [Spirochaetes bacterium RIFOXYC1_FULL_54_7]|nr:MAG: hypothetical protein A3J97_10330 [Spirochaetes bacterium RIFOXYC1_FULL_54_7]